MEQIGGRVGARSPLFSKDGRLCFVTAGDDIHAHSTSPSTGGDRRFVCHGHSDSVTGLALHPSNPRQLISSSLDGTLRFWDISDGSCVRVVKVGFPVTHLAAPQVPARTSSRAYLVVITKQPKGASGPLHIMPKGSKEEIIEALDLQDDAFDAPQEPSSQSSKRRRSSSASSSGIDNSSSSLLQPRVDYPLGDEVACLRPRPLPSSFAFTVGPGGKTRDQPQCALLELDLGGSGAGGKVTCTRTLLRKRGFFVGLEARVDGSDDPAAVAAHVAATSASSSSAAAAAMPVLSTSLCVPRITVVAAVRHSLYVYRCCLDADGLAERLTTTTTTTNAAASSGAAPGVPFPLPFIPTRSSLSKYEHKELLSALALHPTNGGYCVTGDTQGSLVTWLTTDLNPTLAISNESNGSNAIASASAGVVAYLPPPTPSMLLKSLPMPLPLGRREAEEEDQDESSGDDEDSEDDDSDSDSGDRDGPSFSSFLPSFPPTHPLTHSQHTGQIGKASAASARHHPAQQQNQQQHGAAASGNKKENAELSKAELRKRKRRERKAAEESAASAAAAVTAETGIVVAPSTTGSAAPSSSSSSASSSFSSSSSSSSSLTTFPMLVAIFSVRWHAHGVWSACFTPDGSYLLTGGEEAVLVLWQLQGGGGGGGGAGGSSGGSKASTNNAALIASAAASSSSSSSAAFTALNGAIGPTKSDKTMTFLPRLGAPIRNIGAFAALGSSASSSTGATTSNATGGTQTRDVIPLLFALCLVDNTLLCFNGTSLLELWRRSGMSIGGVAATPPIGVLNSLARFAKRQVLKGKVAPTPAAAILGALAGNRESSSTTSVALAATMAATSLTAGTGSSSLPSGKSDAIIAVNGRPRRHAHGDEEANDEETQVAFALPVGSSLKGALSSLQPLRGGDAAAVGGHRDKGMLLSSCSRFLAKGLVVDPRSKSIVVNSLAGTRGGGGLQWVHPRHGSETLLLDVQPRTTVSRSDADPVPPTRVTHVAFSYDGSCMATVDVSPTLAAAASGAGVGDEGGSSSGNDSGEAVSLKFWAWSAGEGRYVLNTRVENPHKADINCLEFHPSTRLVITGSGDRTFKLWEEATANVVPLTAVNSSANSSNKNQTLPSGAAVGTNAAAAAAALGGNEGAGAKKANTNAKVPAIQVPRLVWRCRSVGFYRDYPVTSAAFSGDGTCLALGYSNILTLWDWRDNTLTKALAMPSVANTTRVKVAARDKEGEGKEAPVFFEVPIDEEESGGARRLKHPYSSALDALLASSDSKGKKGKKGKKSSDGAAAAAKALAALEEASSSPAGVSSPAITHLAFLGVSPLLVAATKRSLTLWDLTSCQLLWTYECQLVSLSAERYGLHSAARFACVVSVDRIVRVKASNKGRLQLALKAEAEAKDAADANAAVSNSKGKKGGQAKSKTTQAKAKGKGKSMAMDVDDSSSSDDDDEKRAGPTSHSESSSSGHKYFLVPQYHALVFAPQQQEQAASVYASSSSAAATDPRLYGAVPVQDTVLPTPSLARFLELGKVPAYARHAPYACCFVPQQPLPTGLPLNANALAAASGAKQQSAGGGGGGASSGASDVRGASDLLVLGPTNVALRLPVIVPHNVNVFTTVTTSAAASGSAGAATSAAGKISSVKAVSSSSGLGFIAAVASGASASQQQAEGQEAATTRVLVGSGGTGAVGASGPGGRPSSLFGVLSSLYSSNPAANAAIATSASGGTGGSLAPSAVFPMLLPLTMAAAPAAAAPVAASSAAAAAAASAAAAATKGKRGKAKTAADAAGKSDASGPSAAAANTDAGAQQATQLLMASIAAAMAVDGDAQPEKDADKAKKATSAPTSASGAFSSLSSAFVSAFKTGLSSSSSAPVPAPAPVPVPASAPVAPVTGKKRKASEALVPATAEEQKETSDKATSIAAASNKKQKTAHQAEAIVAESAAPAPAPAPAPAVADSAARLTRARNNSTAAADSAAPAPAPAAASVSARKSSAASAASVASAVAAPAPVGANRLTRARSNSSSVSLSNNNVIEQAGESQATQEREEAAEPAAAAAAPKTGKKAPKPALPAVPEEQVLAAEAADAVAAPKTGGKTTAGARGRMSRTASMAGDDDDESAEPKAPGGTRAASGGPAKRTRSHK